jgi:D-tagatose-1,6-bisphosphate aldolase subunit GatZ/KbaZ
MLRDPRHWKAYYGEDEEESRLRRRYSLSDRCRYYWTSPEVQEALGRLFANLEGRRLPRGLVGQYLPGASGAAGERGPGLAGRLARLHVRRVLDRYARACGDALPVSTRAELPL